MSDSNTFHRYDTSLHARTLTPNDWPTYHAMRNVLWRDRFSFHQDPETVKKYPSLRKVHHHGARGGLQFHSQIYPAGWEVEFYQDVFHVNPHGGKYDFHKLSLMPYLLRKRCLLELDRLAAALVALGFSETTDPKPKDAYARVMLDRASWQRSHSFYNQPRARHDSTDADGAELQDGAVRCCRDYHGHLVQGNVFHHCNNMWWLVPNASDYHNVASFDLFTYVAGVTPRKLCPRTEDRRKAALEDAIRRRAYEQAAALRDVSGLTVEPRRRPA